MDWYYSQDGTPVGPFSRDDIESLLLTAQITRQTLVWREGMRQWLPLNGEPELRDLGLPDEMPPPPPSANKASPNLVDLLSEDAVRSALGDIPNTEKLDDGPFEVAPPPAPKRQSRNPIVRHWRGGYSLGVSYWLVSFLSNWALLIFINVVVATITPDRGYEPLSIFYLQASLWLLMAAVLVWQVVGVWRSAERHAIERQRLGRGAFWARAAQAMVVIGVLQSVATFNTGRDQLAELYRIAFLNDPDIPSNSLSIGEGGRQISLVGGIKYGLARDFDTLLRAMPEVSVVRLASPGGRVAEAEKIATLVKARGLDVYVDEICASACTLVFVAGKNRLLSPGGSLGFHGSYFPGMSKQELASANDDLASQYRSAGVDALFIRRALSVPPDEMWFPTANELQMARVVTVLGGGTASAATTNAVAVPLTPAVAPPKDTKSLTLGEVERELRSASGLMDAIHLVEPETARAIYSFVQAHYGEFGANTDVAAQVKAMMSEVVARHYQEADDDVLVAIATLTADQSAALLAEDPALCHVYLVGGAGSGEAYTRIPENLRSLETELSERVLRTATPRPTLAPGRLEAIYQDVANSAFGASSDRQLQLLAGDVKAVTPADFGQYCMAVVLYYRAIASLAPAAAADAMRGILSSTN